ncbi:ankyrin repeat domain-containing protein 66 [Osmerus mordax]|uniref:ankyrin repeat domain-containing protein 66 n=1 Tax=Osmerus mordax TaxID=8014 RepID=UPI00350F03AC
MTELHQASASGDFELVLDILRKNLCDPNQRDIDWNGKTPLHWAAAKGQTETARILIENGARPCLRADNGWTPAHFAAESGRLGVLRLLHSLHVPIDKEDCSGDKPKRIAEIYGNNDCVRFLHTAEKECEQYRKMSVLKGTHLEDTDDEWEDPRREQDQGRAAKG